MSRGTRPRQNRLDVWVTSEEKQAIEANAARVCMSRSEYLRALGLGYQPKGRFDIEAIERLVKIHGDQGRLGGLLKLWLSEKAGEGASVKDVRGLLEQIESLQIVLARLLMEESRRL